MTLNILHLEDNRLDVELVEAALSEGGLTYTLFHVDTEPDFTRALNENSIDIILADFSLPKYNGLSALTVALKGYPHIPFIFLSGMIGEELAVDTLKKGATDYVLKDHLQRLVPTIQRALKESRELKEKKKIEIELRKSQANLAKAQEIAHIGSWTWDPASGEVTFSDEMCRVLGLKPGDPENATIDTLLSRISPEDRSSASTALNASVEHRKPFAFEIKTIPINGAMRDIKMYGEVDSKNPDTTDMVMGAGQDITETKRLETQLQQAQKMEAIGALASGIAHDFNNILGIILGNTELAMDDVPEWNPAKLKLKEVYTASLRAKDLTYQLLSFGRISDQRQKPIKIQPIVKESMKLLRASLPSNIEIRQNIRHDTESVLADPIQIHQIILNLCTNSAHAMEKNGGSMEIDLANHEITIKTASRVRDLHPGKYVRLSVKDTGHGISPEIIDRIFDPYFTTKGNEKGTGIGLSVVYSIIKNHNGSLMINSTPGEGTSFEIFFPVVQDGESESREGYVQPVPQGREHILLVDDEISIARIEGRMLELLGYEVTVQTSSLEALKVFQENPARYDLVISDMTMPGLTGDHLAEKMMGIRPDIPVILCTGFSEQITEKKAKSMGIQALLTKPILKKDLAVTVRQVLDQEPLPAG